MTTPETITDFARRVLLAGDLAEKLREPGGLTDGARGNPLSVDRPGRPADLAFAAHRTAPAMPKSQSFGDPAKRAVAHHIMANHELQALEVMAATLLKHPHAPDDFRAGVARIMRDEQRHTRMHAARAAKLGTPFGSLPVNHYIWDKAAEFAGLMDYVAGLPLVFEGANLDHTVEFAEAFEAAGDARSAHIMRQIHEDEIGHVAFGLEWLRRWKPEGQDDWAAFVEHLHFPVKPQKARGVRFQEDARRRAGMSEAFIDRLRGVDPVFRPNAPRQGAGRG